MEHSKSDAMDAKAISYIETLATNAIGSEEEDTWYCIVVSENLSKKSEHKVSNSVRLEIRLVRLQPAIEANTLRMYSALP
jgi:hypothetical protein